MWHKSDDIKAKWLFPKFQLLPIFHLQVVQCAWCALILLHRPIFSDMRMYRKIAHISLLNDFCSIPSGKCVLKGRAINTCKKIQFWNFWERPLFESWEYAFKIVGNRPLFSMDESVHGRVVHYFGSVYFPVAMTQFK